MMKHLLEIIEKTTTLKQKKRCLPTKTIWQIAIMIKKMLLNAEVTILYFITKEGRPNRQNQTYECKSELIFPINPADAMNGQMELCSFYQLSLDEGEVSIIYIYG